MYLGLETTVPLSLGPQVGARELPHQLKALVVLPENQSSVPSMVAHSHLYFQAQEIQCYLLAFTN